MCSSNLKKHPRPRRLGPLDGEEYFKEFNSLSTNMKFERVANLVNSNNNLLRQNCPLHPRILRYAVRDLKYMVQYLANDLASQDMPTKRIKKAKHLAPKTGPTLPPRAGS